MALSLLQPDESYPGFAVSQAACCYTNGYLLCSKRESGKSDDMVRQCLSAELAG